MVVLLSGTRGFGNLRPWVVIQNIAVPLIRLLLIFVVLAAGLGTTAIGLAWTVPMLLGFAAAALVVTAQILQVERRSREPPPREATREIGAEFWRFSAPRGFAGALQVAVIWLDVLLVGSLRSSREAAVYAATSRLLSVGSFAILALGVAVGPQVAHLLARGRRSDAEVVFQTATWWLMAIGWPLYLVMALFAPAVLRLFGRGYGSGAFALSVLSLASLVYVGTGNNKVILLMGGGSGWNFLITAVSLALNVGLNLLLIPSHGIDGAALAFAATIVLDQGLTTAVVWRKLGIDPFGAGYPLVVVLNAILFGGLGLLVRALAGPSIPALFAAAILGGLGYLALLWRFRERLRLPALRMALRRRGSPPKISLSSRSPSFPGSVGCRIYPHLRSDALVK